MEEKKKVPYPIEPAHYDNVRKYISKLTEKWIEDKDNKKNFETINEISELQNQFNQHFPGFYRDNVYTSIGEGSEAPSIVFLSEAPDIFFKKKRFYKKYDNQQEEEIEPYFKVNQRCLDLFQDCVTPESGLSNKIRYMHYFDNPINGDYMSDNMMLELYNHFWVRQIEILKPKLVIVYSIKLFRFFRSGSKNCSYGLTQYGYGTDKVVTCYSPNGYKFKLASITNPFVIMFKQQSKEKTEEELKEYVNEIRLLISNEINVIMSNDFIKDKNGNVVKSKTGTPVINISSYIQKNSDTKSRVLSEKIKKKQDEKKFNQYKKKLSRQLEAENEGLTDITKMFIVEKKE